MTATEHPTGCASWSVTLHDGQVVLTLDGYQFEVRPIWDTPAGRLELVDLLARKMRDVTQPATGPVG